MAQGKRPRYYYEDPENSFLREGAILGSMQSPGGWRDLPKDGNYALDAPVFVMPYDEDMYRWAEDEFGPRVRVGIGDVNIKKHVDADVGAVQIDPKYLDRLDEMYQARQPNVEIGPVQVRPHYQLDPMKIELERKKRLTSR